MNINDQFKHQWKVFYKRGEGQAVVYGNNETEARTAALGHYRKQKSQMDFCRAEDIIGSISLIA